MFFHGIRQAKDDQSTNISKGGDKNSGTFQYMQNTHKLDHNVEHHLDNDELKN